MVRDRNYFEKLWGTIVHLHSFGAVGSNWTIEMAESNMGIATNGLH
jgi:hypothetical protein